MKNQFQTFLTAVSASFATLCFVLVTNPDASFVKGIENENLPKEITTLIEHKNTTVSSDPFLGQVIMFAGNFAPRGWAFCEGQVLQISSNTALFSILGTTYGGDGRTTFALPDLRARTPMHPGTGVGLGAKVGSQSLGTPVEVAGKGRTGNVQVTPSGANNVQPSLGVNYIIALQGTFPSRN